jgi:hypothetical protein
MHVYKPSLASIIQKAAAQLDRYIEVHRGYSNVSYPEHLKRRRKEKARHAISFKLIYLDTLAWKCLADHRQKKTTLTVAMKTFASSIERAACTGRFAFPIGVPTYFELDSMTDPSTQHQLKILVDELSKGLCITPWQERIGADLTNLRTGRLNEATELEEFFCSPVEILGMPTISLPDFVKEAVDETTFNKAFFDALYELPFSVQLEVAGIAPGEKWNNSHGIHDLNAGKQQHQSEVDSLKKGIFLELKGCIESWFLNERMAPNYQEITQDTLAAMYHWQQQPASRSLPTMRSLSSLYGLMRFDANRQYKNGDPNDFQVATAALPVADALFTDRKFANFLSDKRIGLDKLFDCTIVSGFEEMSRYLDEQH